MQQTNEEQYTKKLLYEIKDLINEFNRNAIPDNKIITFTFNINDDLDINTINDDTNKKFIDEFNIKLNELIELFKLVNPLIPKRSSGPLKRLGGLPSNNFSNIEKIRSIINYLNVNVNKYFNIIKPEIYYGNTRSNLGTYNNLGKVSNKSRVATYRKGKLLEYNINPFNNELLPRKDTMRIKKTVNFPTGGKNKSKRTKFKKNKSKRTKFKKNKSKKNKSKKKQN